MSIRIDGTNTSNSPGITGADADTGLHFGTNEVTVATNGIDRAIVSSNGNVGIGNLTPSSRAHVKGGSLTIEHGSPVTGTCQLNINCETNSQVSCSFDDQGHISFGTASTPHNQGSFSEKVRFQSGGGISFNGDHATANALDDYEEGFFNPQIVDGMNNVNYNFAAGRYIKVGRLVTADFYLNFDTGSVGNGSQIRIGNLPFIISNDFYGAPFGNTTFTRGGGVTSYQDWVPAADIVHFYGAANSNTFYCYHSGDLTWTTTLSAVGKYVIGQFIYITD